MAAKRDKAKTQNGPRPTPELGLVCITASDAVRYRTVTRKVLLQLDPAQQREKLRALYTENIARLHKAVDFCVERRIKLYRITSQLFPFADDPAGETLLDELAAEIWQAGDRFNREGIRVVVHPDQFVVLNSDSPHVVENSLKILRMHARILDLLAQPRSAWAVMEVHGGKGGRSERLIENIGTLPNQIRSRLALENDEYTYGADEILTICRAAGVPMVFDAHHHLCRESLASYDDESVGRMLAAARDTWPVPEWQMTHMSNGRESLNDRQHSDLITIMPESFQNAPWIEIEAKQKEFAIEKLREEWPAQKTLQMSAQAN